MAWDGAASPPLWHSGSTQASRELLVREGGRDLLPLPSLSCPGLSAGSLPPEESEDEGCGPSPLVSFQG